MSSTFVLVLMFAFEIGIVGEVAIMFSRSVVPDMERMCFCHYSCVLQIDIKGPIDLLQGLTLSWEGLSFRCNSLTPHLSLRSRQMRRAGGNMRVLRRVDGRELLGVYRLLQH